MVASCDRKPIHRCSSHQRSPGRGHGEPHRQRLFWAPEPPPASGAQIMPTGRPQSHEPGIGGHGGSRSAPRRRWGSP